jgi:nitroreductase
MNRQDLEKILVTAVYAPSGDNSQPWRFVVKDNLIKIFSLPEKDNPIFNYRNRGTLVAHGALIENIVIAVKEYGYGNEVKVFPDPQNLNHTADIILQKDSQLAKDPLYKFIRERTTNRKFYKKINLSDSQKRELFDTPQIQWTEEETNKSQLGIAVAANEIVMLEHKELHDFFYNDIRWTRKSERAQKMGLYLHTMELAFPQLVIFKLLQYWPAAKILNKIGIAKFIASQNAKLYSSASAIAIIAVSDKDEEFVTAGRIMQRLWLKAAGLGLAVHPVTGIVYLAQRVMHNESASLSTEHVAVIKKAYENIVSIFSIQDKVIAMLFRIGSAPKPSDYSSRLKPEIKFEN